MTAKSLEIGFWGNASRCPWIVSFFGICAVHRQQRIANPRHENELVLPRARKDGDDFFSVTYKIVQGAPPAMDWKKYERVVLRTWKKILESDPSEETVHEFLEQHPALVPGVCSFPASGHPPFLYSLISKPPLQALGVYVPDFMWIATDSFTVYPIFIEIERPTKRWFTRKGIQHSDLSQALTQLASWKAWISNPQNHRVFLDFFEVPAEFYKGKKIHPQFVLIYGRRSEFNDRSRTMAAELARKDEFLMTFDRISTEWKAHDCLCVKHSKDGYYAISFPPTVELGPYVAGDFAKITGKEQAIRKSAWMSEERRQFLLSRIPYWDDWAKTSTCDSISSPSSE
ncbi:MAG TPA: Shedu immune nuclease family protein [Candidatus Angelobacter sp.]|nr:Shedu immune nuclease family protein [Candidatus Angelobacter sp.]